MIAKAAIAALGLTITLAPISGSARQPTTAEALTYFSPLHTCLTELEASKDRQEGWSLVKRAAYLSACLWGVQHPDQLKKNPAVLEAPALTYFSALHTCLTMIDARKDSAGWDRIQRATALSGCLWIMQH